MDIGAADMQAGASAAQARQARGEASRCRSNQGPDVAGGGRSDGRAVLAGLTRQGQVMLVAEPFVVDGPTRIKFRCPDAGCTSTDTAPFTGSASNIMRHFRYHPGHAGEGVGVVLFCACQMQLPTKQRITYVSDEYGEVGSELLVKGRIGELALHPEIPPGSAQPQPQPEASGDRAATGGAPVPAPAPAPAPARRARTVGKRPPGDDARWAEQDRINAEQQRIIADQQARLDEQDRRIAQGQDFMDAQEDRNNDHDESLHTLRRLTVEFQKQTWKCLAEARERERKRRTLLA